MLRSSLKRWYVCRRLGVSEQTFYRWKAKYDGMNISDAKRLKQLEDENRRLKSMIADQALDRQALRAVPTALVGKLRELAQKKPWA